MEKSAARLVETLKGYGRVGVAFSGGVDSTVVAKAAQLALGENAVAVTGVSSSLAQGELEETKRLAHQIGIRHHIQQTHELQNPLYVVNDGMRCYHCKSELYDQMADLRQTLGFDVICSGANLDDQGDYRPGLTAAAQRHVRHPLQEAGFDKQAVRELAQHWGLPNWDKPATPCLSSRIAVGTDVTPERLQRIDAAESFLRKLGFSPLRVRYHSGDHARIEVAPDAIGRLLEIRESVVERFKGLGFKFVSVDLEGFRSGGLNALVPPEMVRLQTDRIKTA